jgi:membrane-bound lytic murein transglycosylase B
MVRLPLVLAAAVVLAAPVRAQQATPSVPPVETVVIDGRGTSPVTDTVSRPPAGPVPIPVVPGTQDLDGVIDPTAFAAFVKGLKAEAIANGIDEKVAAQALDDLEPLPVVIQRDRTQAETVLTIDQYVTRRLTPAVIRRGREMAKTHRATLARVEKTYGVQSRVLVAVWGLESNFGRFSGVRPTVQALATLAFEGRRAELFKRELFDALRIVQAGHIDLASMKGSWAGAMGQPQFMPSSYLKYAEDFDGDGKRDIWRSQPDVFASVAKYLREQGWDDDSTWGREVKVPDASLVERVGLRTEGCRAVRQMSPARPLAAWRQDGVRAVNGKPLPVADRDASLVDAGGRYYLVYRNYEALLDYNCAHPYALGVAILSDRITASDPLPAAKRKAPARKAPARKPAPRPAAPAEAR